MTRKRWRAHRPSQDPRKTTASNLPRLCLADATLPGVTAVVLQHRGSGCNFCSWGLEESLRHPWTAGRRRSRQRCRRQCGRAWWRSSYSRARQLLRHSQEQLWSTARRQAREESAGWMVALPAHAQPRQLVHSEWGTDPTPPAMLYEWHWDSALKSGL
jgi:hypothetical protein